MSTEEFVFEVSGPARIDVTFTVNYDDGNSTDPEAGTQLQVSDLTVLGKIDQTVSIPVHLSEALDYDLYIPYVTVDADPTATATPDVDYEITSSSITIPAGDLDGALTVDTFADAAGTPSQVEFIGISSFSENTANSLTAFTCDLPPGVQTGDLLLAIIQKQANGSITSAPSGWTQLTDTKTTTTTNSGCEVAVYAKVATASEPSNYTWSIGTTVSGAMSILGYRGVDTSNIAALQIGVTADDTTTTTAIVAPALTTVNAHARLVTAHGVNPSNSSGTANFTTPTGMTERYDSNLTSDGTTLRAALGVFDVDVAAAGSTGTKSSTVSNDGRSVAVSIALEPVASQPVTSGTEFFFVQLGTPLETDSGGDPADITVARAVAKVTIVPDAEVDPEDPPTGATGDGVMVGWSQGNDLALTRAHEGRLGKNFPVVRWFSSDNKGTPSAQAKQLAEDHGGRLMLWSVKTDNWVATSDGTDDAWIDSVGATLQSWAVPAVIFIFYHEPHDNSDQKNESADHANDVFSDEEDGAAGRTAAGYIAAWNRISSRWHDAGYLKRDGGSGKILLGYCAVDSWALGTASGQVGGADGNDYLYPGDDIIDVFCHDAYNTISGTPDESFEDLVAPLVGLCDEHSKPLILGEVGSKPGNEFAPSLKTELGGTKDRDEWFRQAADYMENDALAQQWLKGFCYYHDRRWMFLADDGTPHLGGYEGEVHPAVEGKQGWIDAFVSNDYFVSVPFDPTSEDPVVDPEVPSGCGDSYSSTLRASAVPSGNGEISGLASSKVFPSTIWAIKDSPTAPDTGEYLIRMKTTGTPGEYDVNHIDITGSSNSDWEDCFYSYEGTQGYIYVHDNRDGNGDGLNPKRLYKVLEPTNPDTSTSTTIAATYYWRFPASATTNICKQSGHDANNQNCEVVFQYPVNNGGTDGVIYAVQKGKGSAAVYRLGNPNNGEISTSSASPTVGTLVGKIDHSCPSSFAINVAGDRAISVSHGRHRVWKGQAGDLSSLLSGKATLILDVSGTGAQEEAADFFPHSGCGFQVISEDRKGWIYTNP